MIDRLPPDILPLLRDRFTGGPDSRLYLHLGFYLQWFAITEVTLTTILVYILDLGGSFKKLEFIVRGMDARVKCERLRQAAKAYKPLGENLKTSLGVFEQECIPLRNSIAHSWAFLDHKTDIIYFGSFGRMPVALDEEGKMEFTAGGRQIHLDDLFSQAMWMNSFNGDLKEAFDRAIAGGPLEIDDPKSRLPQAGHPDSLQQDNRAKSDKPPPITPA